MAAAQGLLAAHWSHMSRYLANKVGEGNHHCTVLCLAWAHRAGKLCCSMVGSTEWCHTYKRGATQTFKSDESQKHTLQALQHRCTLPVCVPAA
jgi:hypothetical protein